MEDGIAPDQWFVMFPVENVRRLIADLRRMAGVTEELLTVLTVLMERVESLQENTAELDDLPFNRALVRRARAAIAKATGEGGAS